jgi:hypothetical protein
LEVVITRDGSEVFVLGGRGRWDMGRNQERGELCAYGVRDGKFLTEAIKDDEMPKAGIPMLYSHVFMS